jgi:hypothetical protein
VNEVAQLREALAGLEGAAAVVVYDCGKRLPMLTGFRHELREQNGKLLLHLWSEEGTLVRRVLRVVERNEESIVLEVSRFGQTKPGRLEILRPSRMQLARPSRQQFRLRLGRLLESQFPDEQVDSLTAARDLERSLSGSYVRGTTCRGARAWAVMAVSSAETRETQDGILTYGLLWLDWNRRHPGKRSWAGLRLFVPQGSARATAYRMRALSPATKIELYEIDEINWRATQVDPADAGNFETRLTPRKEVERAMDAARGAVRPVCELAPEAMDAVVPPGTGDVAIRFHGLEFARWQCGRLEFGLEETQRQALVSGNWKALERLVGRLRRWRAAHSEDTKHLLYRSQPERWLESLILRDPARLDARLAGNHLYSQVPAFSAGDRGVLDLLGIRLDGRLVVVELKTAEDIHLALQAADYWLRVRTHQMRGEFQKYGYFGGLQLQDRPPELWLVAPGFRFHPATEVVLRYLSPEIQLTRVGLNENWRAGVQVIFRQ